jgi:type I site-specific restriction endonuclease
MNTIKTRITKTHSEIFDPIRQKWVQQTDEELVRQHFIHFLITEKGVPKSHISVEKQIAVNGLSKRYDIVVYDAAGKPEMVVECKAPHIKITQEVMAQAGCYNSTLRAPIIGVTNGLECRFFRVDFETKQIILIQPED